MVPDWLAEVLAGGDEVVGEDFSETDLRSAVLQRLSFTHCRFDDASLDELRSEGCTFTDCNFDGAELTNSHHLRTAFVACSFDHARFRYASLTDCKLTGSVFNNVNLRTVTIAGGDFTAVSMGGADLRELDFSGVKLVDANFVGSKLDKCLFVGANLRGVRWGQTSLRDADLRGAVLDGLDPRTVDLTGAHVEVEQAVGFARYFGIKIG